MSITPSTTMRVLIATVTAGGGLKAHEPRFRTFTVCVVTDFEAHALWLEPCVDLYCVAAAETKASLVARGVVAEQVAITGIPITCTS